MAAIFKVFSSSHRTLDFPGLGIGCIRDSNNDFFDLAIGAPKPRVHIAVAYKVPPSMRLYRLLYTALPRREIDDRHPERSYDRLGFMKESTVVGFSDLD
jgi:hypothetical protein